MLTFDIFKKEVTKKWDSLKGQASAKKWKSGKRAGMVRRQAQPIFFTKDELTQWLWKKVGLNAIPCRYCGVPIDIISLALDHIHPRSAGGENALTNLQCICAEDNERKGNLTHDAYESLLRWAHSELSPYDQGILLKRLKEAHHGSMNRFGRDRDAAERKPIPPSKPAQQNPINFDLGSF